MFKRKKSTETMADIAKGIHRMIESDDGPAAAVPWQRAVLGKRIVGVDGIDRIPVGSIVFEDGTALVMGMGVAGRDKYNFVFWTREQTAAHYRDLLATQARSVAMEIADKQRTEALVARIVPPLEF